VGLCWRQRQRHGLFSNPEGPRRADRDVGNPLVAQAAPAGCLTKATTSEVSLILSGTS